MKNQYDPVFVEKLFDDMCATYSNMNYITSFGFSERWRKQCVAELNIKKGKVVADLMTGMGECWKYILCQGDQNSKLIGLDFSTEMIRRANQEKKKFQEADIQILHENVFENSIENNSVDYVISGFGLKTFNDEQLGKLADEIKRILRPGGYYSLIDVSVPGNAVLRFFYMFYLKNVIPILGRLFLGNPDTYRMLGIYTENFGNSRGVQHIFEQRNFEVEYVNYFFGCGSGIKGRKKQPESR